MKDSWKICACAFQIKSPAWGRAFTFLHEKKKNYAFFWYLFLNFSTRPAVSTNIFLPVKNGCDAELTSTLMTGYSFPSSHFTVSLVWEVDRLKNFVSLEVSQKTTSLYSGWMPFFILKSAFFRKRTAKIRSLGRYAKNGIPIFHVCSTNFPDISKTFQFWRIDSNAAEFLISLI